MDATTTPTASERIRQARRAQQIARYELEGYPLALVRLLNRCPELSLEDALEGFSIGATRVA